MIGILLTMTCALVLLVGCVVLAHESVSVPVEECYMDATSIVPDTEQYERVLFPTMPRSGSWWSRKLIEAATGIGTASIFPEAGRFVTEIGAHVLDTGAGGISTKRPACSSTAILVKTHFPFFGPGGFVPFFTHILQTVRNPLTNFGAWESYRKKFTGRLSDKFRDYMMKWSHFHRFYDTLVSRTHLSFITKIKYEELVSDTNATVSKMIANSRLCPQCTAESIRTAIELHPPSNIVRTVRTVCASCAIVVSEQRNASISVDDVRWALHRYRPQLTRYGYDTDFEFLIASCTAC